jgi:hypothetical protein
VWDGHRDIRIETVTHTGRLRDPDTFIAMNLNATVDLDTVDAAKRAELIAEFQAGARKAVAPYFVDDVLVHPVSANVVFAAV